MTKIRQNPFSTQRWEHEVEHLIYVPTIISEVGEEKNTFLPGIRGSGKTTILNSLDLRVRESEAVRISNPENVPSRCIGTCLSLLHEFTSKFLRLNSADGSTHEEVFTLYFHLLTLAEVLDTLRYARSTRTLSYSASKEFDFVIRLYEDFPLLESYRKFHENTFLDLSHSLRKLCMKIRIDVGRGNTDPIEDVVAQIVPGDFYNKFVESILNANILVLPSGEKAFLAICIDNAHFLDDIHQRFVNTIIQGSRAPIVYKVSFVKGLYNQTETANPSLPLTNHDRRTVPLDYSTSTNLFKTVCREVFVARLEDASIPNPVLSDRRDTRRHFTQILELIFGPSDYNFQFSDLLRSTSKRRSDILDDAALKFDLWIRTVAKDLNETVPPRSTPAYHQGYTFLKIFDANPDKANAFFYGKEFDQINNYFRQKSAAAIVHFCGETQRELPNSGEASLITLSDGCIRDFLMMQHEIFRTVETTKRLKFMDLWKPKPITAARQSHALARASDEYFSERIDTRQKGGFHASRIVKSIGLLTNRLQTRGPNALASNERGLIVVDLSEKSLDANHKAALEDFIKAINKGQDAGAIRVQEPTNTNIDPMLVSGKLKFRLHRVLAPKFKYAARGPLREVKVPLFKMLELVNSYGDIDELGWADEAFAMIDRDWRYDDEFTFQTTMNL